MSKNTSHISHVKSTVVLGDGSPKLPSVDNIIEGEIAINYAHGIETLSIKNVSNEVVVFSSDNYYTTRKLGDLFLGENSGNTVTNLINDITSNMDEQELVVATALVDLDERKLDKSDMSSYATTAETNSINATLTAHTADTNIHFTTGDVQTQINNSLGDKVDTSVFNTHTASTSHMTSAEKTNLDSLATNIATISGITSTKVNNWDAAVSNSHAHSNATVLNGITSTKVGNWDTAASNSHTHSNSDALSSLTGSVGTMAYENITSYSSATEVKTALSSKSDNGHNHDDRYYTESELTGSSTTVVVAKAANANSVPLSGVQDAADLKAIEALAGTSGLLKKTAANTWALDTTSYSTASAAVTTGVYNATNKTIDLKNAGGTVVSTIDATEFIKDGMISNVEIKNVPSSGTCIVITFNTDSGKDAINIPITQIFDASNYYTKDELTGTSATAIVKKASSASTAASASAVPLSGVQDAADLKAIEALAGTSGLLKKTAANTWALDTTSYSSATEINAALGSKSDTNHTHDGRYAKNAFATLQVGEAAIAADTTADTLTFSGDTFINLIPDATNDKLTINIVTGTSSSSIAVGNHNHDTAYPSKSSFETHTASTSHMTSAEKTNLDSLATNIATISGITSTNVSNWNSKTSNTSTVTKVELGLPTGLSAATTSISTSGKFDVKFSDGYSIPTTARQSNWDTAYSHASGITATANAVNSLTGAVGTMAFQNTSSYSSATQVNTALSGKSNTGHTHSSSNVTSMGGYAKPSSTSAISTGDTLNQAVGKLENALDSKANSSDLDGIKLKKITQSAYDALTTKDSNTLYIIVD